MARDGRAHLRNRFRKLRDPSKFTKLLHSCVALVIEILPASGSVLSDRLHSSIRGRIDKHICPRRRNFQIVDSVEVGLRQTATDGLIAKAAFGSAESTYTDILQTFEFCHWNEICLCLSYSGQSGRLTLSKRIDPLKPKYDIVCSWCGALIRSTNLELPEQMCLICHARMLNDYFQRINKSHGSSRMNTGRK